MCRASPSAAARTTHSVRTARRSRSRCAPAAGEAWSTNFDVYQVAGRGRNAAQFDCRQSRPGTRSRLLARRLATRLCRHGPARLRSRSFSSGMLLNLKSGVKRPLTHNWDRSIANFAWGRRRQELVCHHRPSGSTAAVGHRCRDRRAAAITGAGEVEDFSVGPHKVFYAFSSLGSSADLYAVGFARRRARAADGFE